LATPRICRCPTGIADCVIAHLSLPDVADMEAA